MINQKYADLLQEITKLIAIKNIQIDELHNQIIKLKKQLAKAEKQKGN
jgi:hypothetical protein